MGDYEKRGSCCTDDCGAIDSNPLAILLADAVSNSDPVLRGRAYQKLIQRGHLIARALMGDGVRTLVESMDICNSALCDVSRRINHNEVSFADVESLISYLRQVINNKISGKARYANAKKRRANTIPIGSDIEAGEVDPTRAKDDIETRLRARELDQIHRDIAASRKRSLPALHQEMIELHEQHGGWSWIKVAHEASKRRQSEDPLSPEHCRQIYSRYIRSIRHALRERQLGPESACS